jgi:cytochrome c-type biogenesis protein CcmE
MTRKQKRLILVVGGMASLGVAAALVLSAMSDNLVFFYNPTDIVVKHLSSPGRTLRIGGLVEENSVAKYDGGARMEFKVTDGKHDLMVSYTGVPPSLFREGQGVIAEGKLDTGGMFQAASILAKHDERYMPKELVEKLKEAGEWQEDPAASAEAMPAVLTR